MYFNVAGWKSTILLTVFIGLIGYWFLFPSFSLTSFGLSIFMIPFYCYCQFIQMPFTFFPEVALEFTIYIYIYIKLIWIYLQLVLNHFTCSIQTIKGDILNFFLWSFVLLLSEKAMAPHSSTLAWKIPWMEEPGRLRSMGSLRVGHDWAISLSLFTFMHWRRKWQPTPVFLPGESQGWGSLVGWRLWGRTELDTTEMT